VRKLGKEGVVGSEVAERWGRGWVRVVLERGVCGEGMSMKEVERVGGGAEVDGGGEGRGGDGGGWALEGGGGARKERRRGEGRGRG